MNFKLNRRLDKYTITLLFTKVNRIDIRYMTDCWILKTLQVRRSKRFYIKFQKELMTLHYIDSDHTLTGKNNIIKYYPFIHAKLLDNPAYTKERALVSETFGFNYHMLTAPQISVCEMSIPIKYKDLEIKNVIIY